MRSCKRMWGMVWGAEATASTPSCHNFIGRDHELAADTSHVQTPSVRYVEYRQPAALILSMLLAALFLAFDSASSGKDNSSEDWRDQ